MIKPCVVRQNKSQKRFPFRILGLLLPLTSWKVLFIVIPFLMFFIYSFWKVKEGFIVKEITLINYQEIFTNEIYLFLFGKSLIISLGASILTLILGYPLALYMSRQTGRIKAILYIFVIIPLLTSYIVRIYAMRLVLGSNGVINGLLLSLGIIREPLQFLLFNNFAIFITLCVILSPFMIMPIFTTLEKIPFNMLEASKDLGASDFETFWNITFPLSLPGQIAGFMFIFILSIGDYLTPILVGGTQGMTISKVIQVNFGFAYDWPLGSALTVILLFTSMLIIFLSSKLGGLREI